METLAGKHLASSAERDDCLDLLVSHAVQPTFAGRRVFVHDYPASQASLARIRDDEPAVAERFELFVDAVELANGFHELGDADEQRARFVTELATRERDGLPKIPLDERLLAALEHGLPPSAGVAMGLDRLLMLSTGRERIEEVIAFGWSRL